MPLTSRLSMHFISAGNGLRIVLRKRSIDNRVHARRITGTTSRITTFPHIHRTLLHHRHTFHRLPNLVTSNHSVKAIMFPSTPIGVFLSTSSRRHTRHHVLRLRRGNFDIGFRHLLTRVGRHSSHSHGQTMTPLIPTTSTLILSSAALDVRRIVRGTLRCTHRGLTLTWTARFTMPPLR